MKRTLIILTAVGVFILLVVRMIVTHSRRVDDAQREFVSKLGYDLSAAVDSVKLFNEHAPVGFIYVSVTRGKFENNEKKIGRTLRRKEKFRFMIPREGKGIRIFSKDAVKYKVGDSLIIDTARDQLIIFREGKQVARFVISENLSG